MSTPTFHEVKRNPRDKTFCHIHKVQAGAALREDTHYLTWNYYPHRQRWEAQCEWADTIYVAPAVEEDRDWRKGRTLYGSPDRKNS